MPKSMQENPAESASANAIRQIFALIDQRKNFLLEAGAGAGKTHSLVKALQYTVEKGGVSYLRSGQRIACITYTNVASQEIVARVGDSPVVLSSTIHAFCWSLIKNFQNELRAKLPSVGKWAERITESENPDILIGKKIIYDLGYPRISNEIELYHQDVIDLTVLLMENAKFRNIFAGLYPVIFIDEYQDTDADFVEALKQYFCTEDSKILLGFFGDHWQKIYDEGCGQITHPNIAEIGVGANFRSSSTIVDVLNKIRPDLLQVPKDETSSGIVSVYHTNSWSAGTRLTGPQEKGDLPPAEAHRYLESTISLLTSSGWDIAETKILMLTHNVLAREQGYGEIAKLFKGRSEKFAKKEDKHIKFLAEVVEPACSAYEQKRFGEMFQIISKGYPHIASHGEKLDWKRDMDGLLALRESGTIGEVIDYLKRINRIPVPEAVERRENKLLTPAEPLDEQDRSSADTLIALRNISYREVRSAAKFIEEKTPFSTKHGVKGAEFENVLVVFGRGWSKYNFNQMLEWSASGVPAEKAKTFEHNRNLFYVVCSRPKKRLCLLFTHELSPSAMSTLTSWFGTANIHVAPY